MPKMRPNGIGTTVIVAGPHPGEKNSVVKETNTAARVKAGRLRRTYKTPNKMSARGDAAIRYTAAIISAAITYPGNAARTMIASTVRTFRAFRFIVTPND